MSYADQIRIEQSAYDMRELIADGIGENKNIADSANIKSDSAVSTANTANDRVNNIITTQNGQTPVEVIDSRHDNISNVTYQNLGERLDNHSSQLADMTNKLNYLATYRGMSISIGNDINDTVLNTQIALLNAFNTHVSLCPQEYIDTATSYIFTETTNISSRITSAITNIEYGGNKVTMLKPHIVTVANGDGFPRSTYQPSSISGFFTNWGVVLEKYADMCDTYNIPFLCIEVEMNVLTQVSNYNSWQTLINNLRSGHPNLKITSASAFGAVQREIDTKRYLGYSFYDLVDTIGITTYPNLPRTSPLEGVYRSGFNLDARLVTLNALFNKKINISEVGCTAYTDESNPDIYPIYVDTVGYIKDWLDQDIFYKTMLKYYAYNNIIDGFYVWHINSPFDFNNTTKQTLLNYIGGANV